MAKSRYKRKIKKLSPTAIILAVIFFIIAVAGYFIYNKFFKPAPIEAKGEISFHFMMLGNKNSGDCIYVKAGDNDILIDAGSASNSVDDIDKYISEYVPDKELEYVIVTHSDSDHIEGFSVLNGSIFDLYKCKTIIDFPLTNKKETSDSGNQTLYGKYVSERTDEIANGAKHYSALDCYNNENGGQRTYNLTEDGNVKMEILYNYYYDHEAKDENDYSVCIMFHHGSRKFLFTGDLEESGEEYLIQHYRENFSKDYLSEVEFYKAGHHGSKTSSTEELLQIIKPKMSVVPCCAGSIERPTALQNTFPTQEFIDKISKYTDKVYVPVMIELEYVENDTATESDDYNNVGEYKELNGNIQVISDAEKGVYVECSNNTKPLKDTEWFSKYRTTPPAWN